MSKEDFPFTHPIFEAAGYVPPKPLDIPVMPATEDSKTAWQEKLRFQGYIDDWMKTLGTGVNGHQEEALTLMDMACDELVRARAKIDTLRSALKPFSNFAGGLFSNNFNADDDVAEIDPGNGDWIALCARQFFDARRVYEETDPNEKEGDA